MVAFWDLLDEEERKFLRGFMPRGWEPSRSIQEEQIEPLEEIEKLMQECPQGDAALIGRKG